MPQTLAEAPAVVLDHGPAHAQQGARIGQVLGAGDGGLRAQVGVIGQPFHGVLEHRVAAQRVGVVAVLVARGNHQHAKADDLVQAMQHPLRRPRVPEAAGQTSGDAEPLLDLTQRQKTAVGGQQRAIKARLDPPAVDR